MSCFSHELLSTKIYYTSIYIFYLLFISTQFQIGKNYEYPTSTSRDTCKTIFIILFKFFSIGDSTDLVMRQCDSSNNMKKFIMMSTHTMPCPIISQITNVNLKHEHEPETQT